MLIFTRLSANAEAAFFMSANATLPRRCSPQAKSGLRAGSTLLVISITLY